ncbi:hypothetical protein EVAR_49548_1 [Eumeta japonica]|uniref:Uncharacterized protein n=1 Tax=Eumeta variegata TaxID=151549 RepID=A0A4C1XMP6_EUMVA|nr:hypothetical protein EVAR_49548_1 [Eumeta japonica]
MRKVCWRFGGSEIIPQQHVLACVRVRALRVRLTGIFVPTATRRRRGRLHADASFAQPLAFVTPHFPLEVGNPAVARARHGDGTYK